MKPIHAYFVLGTLHLAKLLFLKEVAKLGNATGARAKLRTVRGLRKGWLKVETYSSNVSGDARNEIDRVLLQNGSSDADT